MSASTVILILLVSMAGALLLYRVYSEIEKRKLVSQVTPYNRGERSERYAIFSLLKSGIDPRAIFHDMYLQKPNGSYTQVDLAVATPSGIIVFEIKEYSGWIFGNGKQKYWTQILNYGKMKNRFYNPIMQNEGHISAIRECLPQNPNIPIFSIVVFFGDCELKEVNYDTPNTYVIYHNYIPSIVQSILALPPADYGNKYEIMEVFGRAVQNGTDPAIRQSQLASAMYSARNTPESTFRYD